MIVVSGNAVFTAQSSEDNPDLLFRRIMLPRLAANVFDSAFCRTLMPFCFVSHRSLPIGHDEPKTLL
jgi:hypothetical protein